MKSNKIKQAGRRTTQAKSQAKQTSSPKRTSKLASPAPATKAPIARPATKLDAMIALLKQPGGATMDQIIKLIGWQKHSVRGAISGALKKKLGLKVLSQKLEGERNYQIVDGAE